MSGEGNSSSYNLEKEKKEKTTTTSTRGNNESQTTSTHSWTSTSGRTLSPTSSTRGISNRSSGQQRFTTASSRTSFAANTSSSSRMITPSQSSGQPPPRPCKHTAVMKDLCVDCGIDIRTLSDQERRNILSEATVSMIHSVPELKVSADVAEELGQTEQDRLLKARKLVLLVDLDQTIIHTTNDINDVQNCNGKDVYSFPLYPPGHPLHSNHPSNMYHTKLRPHVVQFLKNVSEKYQLHICTFGSRMYAHTIANIIEEAIQKEDDGDQESVNMDSQDTNRSEKKTTKKIFVDRILSRDECLDPTSKTGNLKSLFPVGDKMVAIIDDREDVWNFSPNVIAVKPYHYFKNTGDINNPFKGRDGNSKSGNSCLLGMEADIKNLAEAEDGSLTDPKDGSLTSPTVPLATETPNIIETDLPTSEPMAQESSCASKDDDDVQITIPVPLSQPLSSSQLTVNIEPKLSEPSTPATEASSSETPSDSPSTPTNEPSTPSDSNSNTPTKTLDRLETLSSEDSSSNDVQKVVADVQKVVDEPAIESMECVPVTTSVQIVDNDHDDYLLYLEDILNNIHKEFFNEYDEKNKHATDGEANILPDLKEIIPSYRRKTLNGTSIVFSGIIPTNVNQERHRMYQMAKLLGAKITKDVVIKAPTPCEPLTTHVIGAKFGTIKIRTAQNCNEKVKISAKKMSKNSGHHRGHEIFVVNPLWLTTCFERWERVNEVLFLLKESDDFQLKDNVPKPPPPMRPAPFDHGLKTPASSAATASSAIECPVYDPVTGKRIVKKKYPDDPEIARSSGSGSRTRRESGADEPIMFSATEIMSMGKEVDDACSEGSEDFTDDEDDTNDGTLTFEEVTKKRVLENLDSDDEDDFGTFDADEPKGWKKLKSGHGSPKSGNSPPKTSTVMEDTEESTNDVLGLSSESDDDDSDESLDEDAALIEQQFLND